VSRAPSPVHAHRGGFTSPGAEGGGPQESRATGHHQRVGPGLQVLLGSVQVLVPVRVLLGSVQVLVPVRVLRAAAASVSGEAAHWLQEKSLPEALLVWVGTTETPVGVY